MVRPESASVDPVGHGVVLYAVREESECMLVRWSIRIVIIPAYQLDHRQFSSAMQSPICHVDMMLNPSSSHSLAVASEAAMDEPTSSQDGKGA